MRRALAATLILLTGCVDAGAARHAALDSTIGMDEATLVRSVGVPSRTVDADGHRFLAYVDRRVDVGPLLGGYGGYWGFGRFGAYGASFAYPIERTCETTYELAGGRVTAWQLRGNACASEASGVGVPVLGTPSVGAPLGTHPS